MLADAYEFKESRDRKTIYPDEYHPSGVLVIPAIIPLAFILLALVIVCVLVIKEDPRDRLLKASFAVSFGSFGVFTGWLWWKRARLRRRRALATDAVMQDYPWNPHKWVVRGTARLKKTLMGACLLTCFLLMFNLWLFDDGLARFTLGHLVILVFDLIALWAWCNVVYAWLQARKFGASRVEYLRFPYSVNEPVRLRWIVPRNVTNAQSAVFTLRCIHERTEHFIKNGERSAQIVNEEWWAGEWRLTRPERWTPGECIELEWEPMPGLPGTRLNAEEIYFWRLDVRVSLPGTDFFAGYLIPVYE